MATSRKSTRRAAGKKGAPARRAPSGRTKTTRMSTRKTVAARGAKARKPLLGGMTVREAGRMGGLIGGKKGGDTVKRERGVKFYQEIGRLGGQRVRDLIAAGKRELERPSRRRHT